MQFFVLTVEYRRDTNNVIRLGFEYMTFVLMIILTILAVGFLLLAWNPIKSRADAVNVEEDTDNNPPGVTLLQSASPVVDSQEIIEEESEEAEEAAQHVECIEISIHSSYDVLDDIPDETISSLYTLVQALPKLPVVAMDVLSILSRPGTGSKEIAQIIERDQSTAARLLRWVNSSLFGLDGQVTSLQRAVTLLGIDTVRSLVIEDSLGRGTSLLENTWMGPKIIWRHAAAVSIFSRHLARSVRKVEPDVAATTGLLHDIGLLIMLMTDRQKLKSAVQKSIESLTPLIEVEFDEFGYNHQVMGEVFIKAWGLPEVISEAIGKHHSPMLEPFNILAAIIWLSDYLVTKFGFACPIGRVYIASEDEIKELMSRVGLRPPLERYITEGLIRETLKNTQYWGGASMESEGVVTRKA